MHDILGYRKVQVGRHSFWVNPITLRVLPHVHGGADGDPAPPPADEPKFTQADMDRVMGRTRIEARNAAAAELAESLGCTVDEAKVKIQALADAEAAKLDATQRAELAATTAANEAAQARADAAAARAELANTTALSVAGINPAHLGDALRLLDVAADADEATRTAAVVALKERMAPLFTTTVAAPAPGGFTPPTPPTPPGPPAGGTTAKDRAKARFEALAPSRAA